MPCWGSQKALLFTIHQYQFWWVSEFCRMIFWCLVHSCKKITGQGLSNLKQSFKRLSSLKSIHLSFFWFGIFLWDKFVDLWKTVASSSLIKVWTTFMKVSKDSTPYNLLIWTLERKLLLEEKFFWLANNRCTKITDQGLNCLGEGLKRLFSLQSININFDG